MPHVSQKGEGRHSVGKYWVQHSFTLSYVDTLLFILVYPEVVVYKVASPKIFYKFFIMSDDYKLKVSLQMSGSDDAETI